MSEYKKYDFDEKGFTAEYRAGFGEFILNELIEFINTKGIDDKVSLNKCIFQHYLLDVFADLSRLSDFHDCDKPNFEKSMSYCASWWVRRKPLVLVNDCEELIYINEEFAFYLVLHAIDLANKKTKNDNELLGCFEKLIYYLKYRYVNPQTLELFMQGITLGLNLDE